MSATLTMLYSLQVRVSGLTPEKRLNAPPADPQMPSELSRFLKSDDWQKKLVPGSLGGVGVAVTVSDDWFGSVGVCLCVLVPLVSIMILSLVSWVTGL